MFKINPSDQFIKKAKKLIKKNVSFKTKIKSTLIFLIKDPFYPSLKSHKVITKSGDMAFSSKVDEDIRIIWDYQDEKPYILDILDIGGHSGKNKVYK